MGVTLREIRPQPLLVAPKPQVTPVEITPDDKAAVEASMSGALLRGDGYQIAELRFLMESLGIRRNRTRDEKEFVFEKLAQSRQDASGQWGGVTEQLQLYVFAKGGGYNGKPPFKPTSRAVVDDACSMLITNIDSSMSVEAGRLLCLMRACGITPNHVRGEWSTALPQDKDYIQQIIGLRNLGDFGESLAKELKSRRGEKDAIAVGRILLTFRDLKLESPATVEDTRLMHASLGGFRKRGVADPGQKIAWSHYLLKELKDALPPRQGESDDRIPLPPLKRF
jgi:hypothetical protein